MKGKTPAKLGSPKVKGRIKESQFRNNSSSRVTQEQEVVHELPKVQEAPKPKV